MASEKIYWRVETDNRLPWPEWSHTTAECCRARHARTSISAGVKGSQVVCDNWHGQCVLLHHFSSRVQDTFCIHLEGHPVHLESTAPGVEAQSHHLPWTNPDCTGKGWSPRTFAVHRWHHYMGWHSRGGFWERGENSSDPSESRFHH